MHNMTPEQIEKLVLFHSETQRQNITQIRGWIYQLIIISGAIIGFTLPIFDKSQLIKNRSLLIGGLFLSWVIIVCSFWYLKRILSKENNRLAQKTEELKKSLGIKGLPDIDTKSYILDILFIIFIIATVLIILSMINLGGCIGRG